MRGCDTYVLCWPKIRHCHQNPSKLREKDSTDFCAAKQGGFYGSLMESLILSYLQVGISPRCTKMGRWPIHQGKRTWNYEALPPGWHCTFWFGITINFIYSPLLLGGGGSQFGIIEVSFSKAISASILILGCLYELDITVKRQAKGCIVWKILQKRWILDLSLLPDL